MRCAIKMLGLVFVLALSACAGGEGDEVGKFVGRWRPASGEVKTVCPGGIEKTDAATDDVVWIYGAGSDLASTTPLTPCRLKADVTDGTASIVPGHRCTQYDGAGGTVTVTFRDYAFWIAPGGREALESASGEITYVSRGEAKACAFRGGSWYRRLDEATPSVAVR